jgi:hypothetical protein
MEDSIMRESIMKQTVIVLLTMLLGACVIVPIDAPRGKAGGGTVLLCHKGKKTMELPQEAARAHLDHGDRYGPCP